MKETTPGAALPPPVVRDVALALAVTGGTLLLIAILSFFALIRGYADLTLSLTMLCGLLIFIVAGGLGGVFHILMARAFYNRNKIAYQWVRSTSWNPLVGLTSGMGRKLDAPEVRAAFGLTGELTNNPRDKLT